ncbi:MAG: hypothetical protein EA369_08405 [Bradymonadales bacterium]|nr:MAG: hypothetical protein EA369_08405 [Bradymonadales bacterium]
MKFCCQIFGWALLLAGCQGPSGFERPAFELVYPEWNIGEYSQATSSDQLYTVIRDSDAPRRGLVRVRLSDRRIEVIDEEATDAKDLIWQKGGHLVYRVGSRLHYRNGREHAQLNLEMERLQGFHWMDQKAQVFYESLSGQSHFACFSPEAEITELASLPVQVVASYASNGLLYLVANDEQGVIFVEMPFCQKDPIRSERLHPAVRTQYAWIGHWNDKLQVIFLNEYTGELIHVDWTPEIRKRVIDGRPGESYRGMDMAVFQDEQNFGLVYLDAWRLELRIAELKNGAWQSQRIPIPGALGFYNQILELKGGVLKASTNSFRTQLGRFEVSNDDLILYYWDLEKGILIENPF